MSTLRKRVGDHVLYADPGTHAVAEEWQEEWNFSLGALDDWIEQRCPPGQREQALDHRRRAIEAHADGNHAATLPWLLYFTTLVDLDAAQAAMLPPATKGVKFQHRQARIASLPRKLDEGAPDRIRARYEASGGERGTIKALAREFDVSTKTITRIVGSKRKRK